MWLLSVNILNLLCFLHCISCLLLEKKEAASVDDSSDQLKNLQRYELINPVEYSSAHLKNDSIKTKFFQVTAFGSTYDIAFEILYEPPLQRRINIEYIGKNNSVQGKLFKDSQRCFYSGPSHKNNSVHVVLNHCNGLEGFIQTNDVMLFIEPLKRFAPMKPFHRKHVIYRSTDVIRKDVNNDREEAQPIDGPPRGAFYNSTRRRVRRSGYESFLLFINRSKRRIQLYYLDTFNREVPFIMMLVNERRRISTFQGTVWIVKDDKTSKSMLINNRRRFTTFKNTQYNRKELIISAPDGTIFEEDEETNEVGGSKHFIEVLILADDSVVNFHGKADVEKYLMTMMNIAAHIFKDKSLGVNINFEVVKIVLLETKEGFYVNSRSPSKTLLSACNYISTLKHGDENHPNHFDIGIAMTRREFGPSGYAQLYSMCSGSRSCSVVKDEGLTSAFIVAHETAHLLGLDHDGEGEASTCQSEGPRGSIMASYIVSRYDRFHWSKCSKEVLQQNLEYFTCLQNDPMEKSKNVNKELPGALYTMDEQCQFNFGKYSKTCSAFSFDPCRTLWCQGDSARKCVTMRGPALDGSICERNKHCKKGECVEMNNWTSIREAEVQVTLVNGDWSTWTIWSSCSQSCGIGVRSRERFCNNPKPDPGGKSCEGKSNGMDVCSTANCHVAKGAESLRTEQCERINDGGWTLYRDHDVKQSLQEAGNNLNCTFDNGLCNWIIDIRSEIRWILRQGGTPSVQTGPNDDHTRRNGQGKYIFMEASSTQADTKFEGNVARFVSPRVRIPRVCFSLYYHMWGEDMGSLNINILHSNGTEHKQWSTSGDQGNRWIKVQLTLQNMRNYQLVIEAVRGNHWAGDIAIDDISVYAGVCPSDEADMENSCKLSCRLRDLSDFRMNDNVIDGVACGDQRNNDICLGGKCVSFGCDNKLESKLKFDDCGICGGNGSSCVKMKGRKNLDLRQDYEVMVTLHKGTTFINLTGVSPGSNYFGIRRATTRGVYLSKKNEDYYNIDGTTFHFKKRDSGQQDIWSKGPTQNDLQIIVHSLEHARNVPVILDYEYFEPSTKSSTYRYKADGWHPCSQTCGTGKQQSLAKCVRDNDNQEVDKEFCSHLQKPLSFRVCNQKPCQRRYKWRSRTWSRCSKTCGGGIQQRNVICIRQVDRTIVPERYCRTARPNRMLVCNKQDCPKRYIWKNHEWNACTATCGGGLRTRLVSCVEELTGTIADDASECKQTKPDTVEPCAMSKCENFVWKITAVGKCSVECGDGFQMRVVNCVKESDRSAIVSNQYCDGPAPQRVLTCSQRACPEYEWSVGEQSPCSVTCGEGVFTQTIRCLEKISRKSVAESYCKQKKPPGISSCQATKCNRYKVAYSEWGRCTGVCGVGVQKRRVYCFTEDLKKSVNLEYCRRSEEKIIDSKACQLTKCSTTAELDCDFDSQTTCNWEWVHNDDFDWTVAKRTPSLKTGPLFDHTKRNGYFAYIEASRPRQQGDMALLVSPYLHPRKEGCLVFWYHMSGSTMGRLRLYASSNASSKIVFEQNGHVSRQWNIQKIDLNYAALDYPKFGFKFIFEGRVGNGPYSDIALDDIKFHDEPCERANIINNPIVQNCREISPLCLRKSKRQHCLSSSAYRILCCKTCADYMITKT